MKELDAAKKIQFFYGFYMDNVCCTAFYNKLKVINPIITRIDKSFGGK
jgi:hypothetical protein